MDLQTIQTDLLDMGFIPHFRGFKVLALCIQCFDGLKNMTEIYNEVSDETGLTINKIEKDVRRCLLVAEKVGAITKHYSNKEFIALYYYKGGAGIE